MRIVQTDTLIIGSGLAGLMTAHCLSADQHVICLTKGEWSACNSFLAQGGIASVTSDEDSWMDHTEDTLIAGNYHNDDDQVAMLTQNSTEIIQKLVEIGVPFDRLPNGDWARTKEGGHRRSRILHAGGDATGRVIMETLKAQLPKHTHIHENTQVIELIVHDGQCTGVWARDSEEKLVQYQAQHIILATGGVGQLYHHTTNAHTITGDGIALAYRAGALCTDMEFLQFHPTLLNASPDKSGLISEAVRGEGAFLVNQKNERVMEGVHPLKDLAPRDIVARTLYQKLLIGDQIFLDIHQVKNFEQRFPTIFSLCVENGLDLSQKKIPVTPGAHFIMGGVTTDEIGRTSIDQLYAIGETACTGVHGANRLASNSLLEAAGFAMRLSTYINQYYEEEYSETHYISEPESWFEPKDNRDLPSLPEKKVIQDMVTRCLGIIRDPGSLEKMKNWLMPYIEAYENIHCRDLMKSDNERWNMITIAWLMTLSAIEREESRGAHYRLDFPDENKAWLKRRIPRSTISEQAYSLKN